MALFVKVVWAGDKLYLSFVIAMAEAMRYFLVVSIGWGRCFFAD